MTYDFGVRFVCVFAVVVAALTGMACREGETTRVPAPPPAPGRVLEERWWAAECPPPMPHQVGRSITPPRVVTRVEPVWPQGARGIVIVATVITTEGRVCAARVVKIAPELGIEMEQRALTAVRQWRFEPATRNGAPISVVYHLSLKSAWRSSASATATGHPDRGTVPAR